MRILLAVLVSLPTISTAAMGMPIDNCPLEPIHRYGLGLSVGVYSETAQEHFDAGWVTVSDTNVADCDGDNVPGDFDGDYDAGVGGGFFGYGPWAWDVDCDYDLNVYGPEVVVDDIVWGNQISFVVGEDDQSGPIKVQDPITLEWTCTTDGGITPCEPYGPCPDPNDPTRDHDDCLSVHYVGIGATCGTGGGDGGFWVFLFVAHVDELGGTVGPSNPPTAGTITNLGEGKSAWDSGEDLKVRSEWFAYREHYEEQRP